MGKTRIALLTLGAGLFVFAGPPEARASSGVESGILTCNVASGWGFLIASARDLDCTYSPRTGITYRYLGQIMKFGIDIGYTGGGVLVWGVVAPTSELGPNALSGDYAGLSGSATVGVGAGADVLIGGNGTTISLQPLSVEGSYGLNVAAGVTSVSLHN